MSNQTLRQIVTGHLEIELLERHFGALYPTATVNEKQAILMLVSESIENRVDQILNAFVSEINRGSPDHKKRRAVRVFNAIMTLIANIGLALAVNQENAGFITITALIIIAAITYQIFFDTN